MGGAQQAYRRVMGKLTGFLEFERVPEEYEAPQERVRHSREFIPRLSDEQAAIQGARCMDCGTPFCMSGCPVNNIIPDWNDLVYQQDWKNAIDTLHSTNNFPEFTGRICPAPCEAACTLNIIGDPVGIKSIEHAIADKAWEMGWAAPHPPERKTGKRVAVIGSGPAGLACAQQLARAGHGAVVYEREDRIGGLLRYGIPDFKMEKHLIDRRMEQMRVEGVEFRVSQHVGVDVDAKALVEEYDAVVLTGGAELPRDLPVPGRELDGVHFAMEFLPQQNRVVAGERVPGQILATDKRVVVIGGGDTGSDCVGTSNRQRAKSVTQFELLPQPPEQENKPLVWPYWPVKLRSSSSHEEGCERDWAVATKRFEGRDGKVEKLVVARVAWQKDEQGRMIMREMPKTEFEMKADLVLLAMGFLGPVQAGLIEQLGVAKDPRSNVAADTETYRTSLAKVFAAGDIRRGQSLVVWAIREGRQAARAVDEFLMGCSELPR
jgi:glutamate synthase (NADPH/NADH) small chain